MQSRFISHTPSCRRLILIFAGWSTTPSFYRHIHAEGWDVAIVWDYTSLDLDASFLDQYSTVFVVAWSMGVAAAAHAAATSIDPSRVAAAFAVNGTLFPSSDKYGIPEAVYEGTRATLSPKNLLKFTKRMGYIPPVNLKDYPPLDDIYLPDFDSLGVELENMRSHALKGRLPWKRAYISIHDRIFPASAMQRAWSEDDSHPDIILLDAEHYVDLQQIITKITPDTDGIARRFGNAVNTYNDNAIAQRKIIDTLFDLLPDDKKESIHDILEIGAGSGLLSHKLLSDLPLNSATFLDLYPINRFGVIEEEKYVTADAELWMHTAPDNSFDLIASSSTIQWFADPATFFCEASRALRRGGILLCSTFLPGNLHELDSKRPSPLLYRTEEEIRSMLKPYFSLYKTFSEPITIDFPTRRALLRHIQLTGVATSASSLPESQTYKQDEKQTDPVDSSRHTLTYLPLYIMAYKK